MNHWVDSKHSVNSAKPHEGNAEPSQRSTREGVETRHGEPNKTCTTCRSDKPLNEFYKKNREGRLDSTCKSCRIIQQRERVLGVSEDDYRRMHHQQHGRCGICQRRLYSKRYKAFAVDHCHQTGRVRGLLCSNCNTGIGLFRDSDAALLRAANWVKA